jgi:hypothetical protein
VFQAVVITYLVQCTPNTCTLFDCSFAHRAQQVVRYCLEVQYSGSTPITIHKQWAITDLFLGSPLQHAVCLLLLCDSIKNRGAGATEGTAAQ